MQDLTPSSDIHRISSQGGHFARVAERQTRWLQVPVSERAWGFKSPLAHVMKITPVIGRGDFFVSCLPLVSRAVTVLGREDRDSGNGIPCSQSSPEY